MGTLIGLNHPRARKSDAPHYPFRVQVIGITAGTADTGNLSSLYNRIPAQYEAAQGGNHGTFAIEAPTTDRIALLGYYSGIVSGQEIVLTWPDGTRTKAFSILDVIVDAAMQTMLLTVEPRQ